MSKRCHIDLGGFVEDVIPFQGYGAIAKNLYRPGDTVCRNDAFAHTLSKKHWSNRCGNCYQTAWAKNTIMLQCSRCKLVKYCSVTCQQADYPLHRAVCRETVKITTLSADIVRDHKVLLIWLDSVDELIIDDVILLLKTIALLRKSHKLESKCQRAVDEANRPYIQCCPQHIQAMTIGGGTHDDYMIRVIDTVCTITNESMEFVAGLLARFHSNNFGIIDELMNHIGSGVYPRAAILNHSCCPNCIVRYSLSQTGPLIELVAIKHIDIGEQLHHCYVDRLTPYIQRSDHIKGIYGFMCSCMACKARNESTSISTPYVDSNHLAEVMRSPFVFQDYLKDVNDKEAILSFLENENSQV